MSTASIRTRTSSAFVATFTAATLLLGASAVVMVAPAHAADELPSWQGSDTRTALTNERAGTSWISELHRSWDDLPDGGAVMLAFDDFARLRRLNADGSTQWEFRPGSAGSFRINGNLTVRYDGAGGAYLMMDGVGNTCDVWRVDATGQLAWQRPANGSAQSSGKCAEFHVLFDGSVIALTNGTIARLATDGGYVWNALAGAEVIDSAISPTGVLWVLTWVPGGHGIVRRFDLAGTSLGSDTFACNACIRSLLMNLDFAANGDVLVVGQGGQSTGQVGVFARYDANGVRQHVALDATTDHTMEIGHDVAGNVYVRAENAVSRVDPVSGDVLWSKPFGEMLPIDNGVLVATPGRSGLSDLSVTRYDANGATSWTRTLATSVSGFIDAPKVTPLGPTFLLQQDYTGAPGCGESPQLVTLNGAGSIVRDLRACTSQLPTQSVGVDARDGVGVLAIADAMLVMRDAQGNRRWQNDLCTWCDFGNETDKRFAAVLNDDGGAWVLARRELTTPAYSPDRLERLDAAGIMVASTPIHDDVNGQSSDARLLRASDDVAMVRRSPGGNIEWLRVDNAGVVRATATLPIGCRPGTCSFDAYRRADGGANIVVTTRSCSDRCYPVVEWQVRADGTEIRHFGPQESTAERFESTLDRDGTLVVVSNDALGFLLESFAPDGTARTPLRIAGMPPALKTEFTLYGPLRGAFLIDVGSDSPNATTWLVRISDAAVLNQRTGLFVHAATPRGYIVAQNVFDLGAADLVDALTLQDLQHFALPTERPLPDDYRMRRRPRTHWTALADGTVYATDTILTDEQMIRTRTSRFAVTGSPADDTIFTSGFEFQ